MAGLNGLGAREHGAVHGVNDWCGTDHPTAEVSAVETLDCVLATLDTVKLEVDVALAVRVKRDVDDVAVLRLGLSANVIFELLLPVVSSLPEQLLTRIKGKEW